MYACGDDGDENAKAAFHALKELDGSKATVTFFITDAGYHRSKRDSPTAKAEEEFLLAKGVDDADFYAVFDSVSLYIQHGTAPCNALCSQMRRAAGTSFGWRYLYGANEAL